MADDLTMNGASGGVYDDDRLLSLALGLDDDPGLVEAMDADDVLRRRFEAVRADVDAVASGVLAAVPAPDEDYTDLSDPRWAQLQEFFAPGAEQPVKARRGSRRWLRVLAPAAVVVLALAVGVTVIQRQNQQSAGDAERTAKAADTLTSAGSTAGGAESAPMATPAQATLATIHDQLDEFATVVLATARQARGAFQQFVVVRIFKGDSPDVMNLRVVDHPTDTGRLHLLMVKPTPATLGASPNAGEEPSVATTATVGPSAVPGAETGLAGASPIPGVIATTAAMAALGGTIPLIYTYEGELAVARELPAGMDPAAVVLP
jgi:negative regulator of sigma E activity